MKIQCDVCEKAQATVICCADEAALCERCDVEVHAANRLASKHQRLHLQSLSKELPRCDICQEKTAFIFCVEDRALFCQDCDEPVHSAGIASKHTRLLATGIKVALSSKCAKSSDKIDSEPSSQNPKLVLPAPQPPSCTSPTSWVMDDLLHFSDFETTDKKESVGFNDQFEWFSDIGMFNDHVPQQTFAAAAAAAAEVPQLSVSKPTHTSLHKNFKSNMPNKRPRIEITDDDEYFCVPDLG